MQDHDLEVAFDTPFEHYEVVDTTYGGRKARLLYSGQRQAAQSGLALDDRSELLFDYNERFMELVRGLLPRRILLLGGGAFTLPKAINEELPDAELQVVELDRDLLDIAQRYFDFVPTKQTQVYLGDAIDFLAADQVQYDLIMIDVFTHTTVPSTFQTPMLARSLVAHLREGGVVAMNLIGSYHGLRSAALRRQIATFKTAFETIELFPAGREPSLWYPQNFVLTAQVGNRPLAPYLLYTPLALPVTLG